MTTPAATTATAATTTTPATTTTTCVPGSEGRYLTKFVRQSCSYDDDASYYYVSYSKSYDHTLLKEETKKSAGNP